MSTFYAQMAHIIIEEEENNSPFLGMDGTSNHISCVWQWRHNRARVSTDGAYNYCTTKCKLFYAHIAHIIIAQQNIN